VKGKIGGNKLKLNNELRKLTNLLFFLNAQPRGAGVGEGRGGRVRCPAETGKKEGGEVPLRSPSA